MAIRIIYSLILLLCVLFAPFWFFSILGILGMFYFSLFWEMPILAFLADMLYGAKEVQFLEINLFSFLWTILIFGVIEFLKKKIKFYPTK